MGFPDGEMGAGPDAENESGVDRFYHVVRGLAGLSRGYSIVHRRCHWKDVKYAWAH